MKRDIFVIGASAGGVEALKDLMVTLPRGLPAALLVVLHLPASSESHLAEIINRVTDLRALQPRNEQTLLPGHIYIAPPNRHMILRSGKIEITLGPKENGVRPSIDALFRSAAEIYGPRVTGILLTGLLSDGAAGLQAIKEKGGLAVVQDPQEAAFPSMPLSAIDRVPVDYVLPVRDIGRLIREISSEKTHMEQQEQVFPEDPDPSRQEIRSSISRFEQGNQVNTPTVLTCPDCGGALWEIREGDLVSYQCHVGHRYETESLSELQTDKLENALWVAVRMLKEREFMMRRLAKMQDEYGNKYSAGRYHQKADEFRQNATLLRSLIENGDQPILNGAAGSEDPRQESPPENPG